LVTSEGGMITTNDEGKAEKIRIYGLHGMDKDAWARFTNSGFKHYDVIYPGYKYNMTDIQASMGIHQLKKIDSFLVRREEIWHKYDSEFKGLPIRIPPAIASGDIHARHLYQILIDKSSAGIDRDTFQKILHKQNIGTGVHYTSIHLFSLYKNLYKFKRGDFPNSEYISDRTISLPLSPSMTNEDVDDVVHAVKNALQNPMEFI
jgi:dTDP-4-amino-4,6-dideoxygalactose transaminase